MKDSSAKVIVQKVHIGQGLVASTRLSKGETIISLEGKLIDADKLSSTGGKLADNAFRFDDNTYLSPKNEFGDFLNHSCSPNARIVKRKNRLFIVAVKNIKKGEEVVIDYATTLAKDDIWKMKCSCGSQTCRGMIKTFNTLPKSILRKYLGSNIIPRYIRDIPE